MGTFKMALRHCGTFLVAIASLSLGQAFDAEPQHAESQCVEGRSIPNSNRTASSPCLGKFGDECTYECDKGFIKIGRHVCQSYSTTGHTVIDAAFFGGRCDRLCPSTAARCAAGTVPVRLNISEGGTACLQTTCRTPDDALRQLARGAYETFRRSRNPRTGQYIDTVVMHLPAENQNFAFSGIHNIGLGLVAEVIAIDLGFVGLEEARARVLQTLRSCVGLIPGFTLDRNPRGWLPTFIDGNTGRNLQPNVFSTDSTALSMVGILFASKHFEVNDPASAATAEISNMTKQLFATVQWDSLLCDNGKVTGRGTGIPWLMDNANGCQNFWVPDPDGFYTVNEMLTAVWLAFEKACSGQALGECSNKPVEDMWKAWQGRRYRPSLHYGGHSLLTVWPAYALQLPYYLTHPFNSDAVYQSLFRAQWEAERDYFTSSAYYAGDSGRYGLGAGPTETWCAGGAYLADLISNQTNVQTCKMYSPYSLAGYLPAAPEVIKGQLLELLAIGEASLPLSGTNYSVLWRKSLIDPGWSQGYGVTMVDFAAEFYGLATLWLGAEYFQKYTNHWETTPDIVIM